MFDQLNDPPQTIDLSERRGPMELTDWAAPYPTLPARTISLCLWEAGQVAQSRDSAKDRVAAIAWLVAERLEEL
jgi:hypothetical protein